VSGQDSPETLRRSFEPLYRAAQYRVFLPEGLLLLKPDTRINDWHDRFGQCATFITACNPGSRPHSPEHNRQLTKALAQALQSKHYRHYLGEGSDPNRVWPGEASLLVLGMSLPVAAEYARQLGQNAWLSIDEAGMVRLEWSAAG
jgi:hypothetical protein